MHITMATVLLTLLLAAPPALAATIVVPPGPGTPVQDAIDAAEDGDTIRLLLGSYPESLLITKRIKLRGVRSSSVEPDGTTRIGACASGTTITIYGDGAQLRGIQVIGGREGAVSIFASDRVKLTDVYAKAGCEVVSAPVVDVEHSTRVRLTRVWAVGVPSLTVRAGIRIAATPQAGSVRVSRAVAVRNDVGILLEDNGILAVRVAGSDVNFNQHGIVLRDTSRAVVTHNELIDNVTTGIELDATSSANAVVRNAVSGSATDVVDGGTANCWRNNTFTTGSVPPCP